MRRLLLLVVASALGACVNGVPPPRAGCHYTMYPMETPEPIPGATLRAGQGAGGEGQDPLLVNRVHAALQARPERTPFESTPPRGEVLVLSGGSQYGAFGAGFFAGLPVVPDYQIVTAVSTGALQSTLLFLANQPIPEDRRRPAYMSRGGNPRSNVEELARAYSIDAESDLLKVGGFGLLGGLVRGSIATFKPMRHTLELLISPGTIHQIAAADAAGRLLLVGVTNVSDGKGYAIDLTELAGRVWKDPALMPLVQACYIDAVIASSSVPLAVPPVSLKRAMQVPAPEIYIDGGARFGVFWTQLRDIVAKAGKVNVSIVVNQDLTAQPWLDDDERPVRRWTLIDLALRAEKVMENQLFRFSVESIATKLSNLRYATLSNRGTLVTPLGSNDYVMDGRSCKAWMKEDKEKRHPTEFHAQYMRCLLAYARERGRAADWNADSSRRRTPELR